MMGPEWDEMLKLMTPEDLEQMAQLGTIDEKQAMLQQQLARSQELSQPSGRNYYGGIAGGLGALADIVRGYRGGAMGREAEQGMAGLTKQREAGRGSQMKAYQRALLKAQQDALLNANSHPSLAVGGVDAPELY